MHFKMFGPYDISDREASRHTGWLDKDDFDHLWDVVDESIDKGSGQLSGACGVYLYGVRGVEGKRKTIGRTLPWYVGKAEKQTFRKECFNGKNQNEFNRIWSSVYRGQGTPFLYLFARMEDESQFSPVATDKYPGVRFVEELLIQLSLAVNTDLVNKQLTSQAQQTSIRGILNSRRRGKLSKSVSEFRDLLGMTRPIDIAMPSPDAENSFMYNYEISGPYDVPVQNKRPRIIDPEDVHQMWEGIRRGSNPELLDACGVYVLAIRHGTNVKPWYIGTASSATFKAQCFKKDMDEINPVVEKRGAPVIYFLPLLTSTNKLAKASEKDRIRTNNMKYVRAILLRYGAQVNKEIFSEDKRDAEMLRNLKVEGLINASRGRRRHEVSDLRRLLGLEPVVGLRSMPVQDKSSTRTAEP